MAQLRCPIFATPFAAAVLRRKLGEAQLQAEAKITVIKPGASFELPPVRAALHARHPFGAGIAGARHPDALWHHLHTGDFKLDPTPMVGPPTDEESFRALGDEGVLAMVCDSTNAMVEGHSGSEAEVRTSMAALIRPMRGRVAVTCFASNVARVESVALAAKAAGRHVALVGRSLRNLETAARDCGYLRDVPEFVPEEEAGSVPRRQFADPGHRQPGRGPQRLARIAADTHRNIALGEGDTVVFSSRVIPGNERAIGARCRTIWSAAACG